MIELGCGIGLPGLVSACLGAKAVYLTDLPVAELTLRQLIGVNTALTGKLFAESLCWGHSGTRQFLETLEGREVLQGTKPASPKVSFDVILCSDVIYAGDVPNTVRLVETINQLVHHCNAREKVLVINCYEKRFLSRTEVYQSRTEANIQVFNDEMRKIGFVGTDLEADKYDVECHDELISICLYRYCEIVE